MCIWLVWLPVMFLCNDEDITYLTGKYSKNPQNINWWLLIYIIYIHKYIIYIVLLVNVSCDNYMKGVLFSLPFCKWAVRVYSKQILEKEKKKKQSEKVVSLCLECFKEKGCQLLERISEQMKMVGWLRKKIWGNTLRGRTKGARCVDWKGWVLRSVRWEVSRIPGQLIMRLTLPPLEYS